LLYSVFLQQLVTQPGILIMTNKSKPNGKGSKRPGLDQNIQAHIGRKLRAVYDEVATAPIPDRIVELLAKLEESQRK
jgi:hypothetical protein